jgi:hypothetical protein
MSPKKNNKGESLHNISAQEFHPYKSSGSNSIALPTFSDEWLIF